MREETDDIKLLWGGVGGLQASSVNKTYSFAVRTDDLLKLSCDMEMHRWISRNRRLNAPIKFSCSK